MGSDTIRSALRVPPGPIELSSFGTDDRPIARGKRDPADELPDLQERLYAESTAGGRRSILLVLQGMDTAGKGGVTEHVVGAFGVIGVQYAGFKKPTEDELAHDFLWRIRKRLPPPGYVGVFDRSHYEDVLITRVHGLIAPEECEKRYEQINDFERELVAAGTTVVKCFLHISPKTQRKRLLARLDKPDKHWKFNPADIDERQFWDAYQAAYELVLERCSTDDAPWYVIPSDHKKYRNWLVGELLREVLRELDPQYPDPHLDVDALKARLGRSD
jgi:PPK2 family polyphosphate:nucleotide phosphotransferase